MKFNVHKWNGKEVVAKQFGLSGRFASYPHIDAHIGQATSNSLYTVVA